MNLLIHVRIAPEERQALDQAAAKDERRAASMMRKITVQWLRANGYLPPVKEPQANG